MALAAQLINGFKYRITEGPHADEVVTVVNNKAFPDGHPHQRKVTVLNPVTGTEFYMLPRQLDSTPVIDEVLPAAPVYVQPMPMTVTAEETVTTAPLVDANDNEAVGRYIANPITDPMDPRLDHLRPSRAKVKRYINRQMANGMSDVEFLLTFTTDIYRERNQDRPANVMLKGDTQSGKTFLVEVLAVKWAEARGLPKPLPIFTLVRLVRRDGLRPVRSDHQLHRPGHGP